MMVAVKYWEDLGLLPRDVLQQIYKHSQQDFASLENPSLVLSNSLLHYLIHFGAEYEKFTTGDFCALASSGPIYFVHIHSKEDWQESINNFSPQKLGNYYTQLTLAFQAARRSAGQMVASYTENITEAKFKNYWLSETFDTRARLIRELKALIKLQPHTPVEWLLPLLDQTKLYSYKNKGKKQ